MLQPINAASAEDRESLLACADYLAPELAQPGTAPNGVTDVYSLGCTLYEMLTGQVPFPGGSALEKLQRHATEAIKPMDANGVPAAIGQVVAYMMAKNAGVRFQQAAIVSEQVTPYLDPAGLAFHIAFEIIEFPIKLTPHFGRVHRLSFQRVILFFVQFVQQLCKKLLLVS